MSGPGDGFSRRINAVEARLETLAVAELPHGHVTSADPATGEQWDARQVWAHIGEFGGYWLDEARTVVREYHGEPVPFGRVKTEAGRVGAIERDRDAEPVAMLWEARDAIDALREFVGAATVSTWEARGRHKTRGLMTVEAIVDEFLVGHYEEHAEQLEEILGS